ncbi:patatin-like phospholipase family protein [Ammoniphilus sp. CFH 90114]|uniref:patatin-like phospholipase family protein n=1 Tax=Ammoniphilus sp. CFH 90114 TaxID=2493665 RepID=UPI00100FEA3D|nr:patatin-like phospholipase family protein [Ammoniphilus sp. CFH 90114]RXT07808.1 phospholipase [Ammoniphilus sp. CFH 90114]
MKADAVFEGGGIKGLAFLGAIERMEEAGYQWERIAGTSAGSIIATMLAAGFTGKEVSRLFLQFPFDQLERRKGICRIPYLGPWAGLTLYNGIYNLCTLEDWLNAHLRQIGKMTFGDLPKDRLKIVAADVTQNRMCILPDDLPQYGINPATFPLARAARLSCSIPFFFRPLCLQGNVIVDGAILSNYPIWIFDDKDQPRWPTFGFRLPGKSKDRTTSRLKGPLHLAVELVRTMMDGHDNRYIDKHSAARTIFIEGIEVGVTQFKLSTEEKQKLVALGRQSAEHFLAKWSFEQYIKMYRPRKKKMI